MLLATVGASSSRFVMDLANMTALVQAILECRMLTRPAFVRWHVTSIARVYSALLTRFAFVVIVTYYLTALTSYIQRIYNHQGYGFYYATWEPQSIPGFPTLVNPQYSGLLMIADFISGSSTSKDPWRVVQLPLPAGSNDTLSAWAIYEGGELTSTKQGWGDDDQSPGLLQDAGLRRLILTNGQR